jgi:hypothetical protein
VNGVPLLRAVLMVGASAGVCFLAGLGVASAVSGGGSGSVTTVTNSDVYSIVTAPHPATLTVTVPPVTVSRRAIRVSGSSSQIVPIDVPWPATLRWSDRCGCFSLFDGKSGHVYVSSTSRFHGRAAIPAGHHVLTVGGGDWTLVFVRLSRNSSTS